MSTLTSLLAWDTYYYSTHKRKEIRNYDTKYHPLLRGSLCFWCNRLCRVWQPRRGGAGADLCLGSHQHWTWAVSSPKRNTESAFITTFTHTQLATRATGTDRQSTDTAPRASSSPPLWLNSAQVHQWECTATHICTHPSSSWARSSVYPTAAPRSRSPQLHARRHLSPQGHSPTAKLVVQTVTHRGTAGWDSPGPGSSPASHAPGSSSSQSQISRLATRAETPLGQPWESPSRLSVPSSEILNSGSHLSLCPQAPLADQKGFWWADGSWNGNSWVQGILWASPHTVVPLSSSVIVQMSFQHILHHNFAISTAHCNSMQCTVMLNTQFSGKYSPGRVNWVAMVERVEWLLIECNWE